MAEGKKGFVLYINKIYLLDALTDEQTGILFKHIFNYVNDKYTKDNEDSINDAVVKMAWLSFKADLKEDLKKWKNISERNRANGQKGGRPRNQENPKNPMGNLETQKTQENPEKPKKADIDIESVSVLESVSDKSNINNIFMSSDNDKKTNKLLNILEHWNKKGIIKHQKLTEPMKKAYKKALKDYSLTDEDIIKAIDHYAQMYFDSNCWLKQKWSLDKFLSQNNACINLTDEGGWWNTYNNSTPGNNEEVVRPIRNDNDII